MEVASETANIADISLHASAIHFVLAGMTTISDNFGLPIQAMASGHVYTQWRSLSLSL